MGSLADAAARTGGWADLPFLATELSRVEDAIASDGRTIAPPAPLAFRALELCQPEDVRCAILGQDPYPTPGHAHGLAFSVPEGTRPLPPSLKNILRELADDLTPRNSPDLSDWARGGVLLLNTSLTVPEGEIDAHRRVGWRPLIDQVLNRVSRRPSAFILWGKRAQDAAAGIDPELHLKVETAHPSPLAARKGFFGSRPFSRVNDWLASRGEAPIDWAPKEAA